MPLRQFKPRANLRKRIAGRIAKKSGEEFEYLFKAMCNRQLVTVTRIPDGCKQIGANRIIRVKTPFDFVISYQGNIAFIDTKKINQKSFPNSQIDENQVSEMHSHNTAPNFKTGYVVHLSKINQVIFIETHLMIKAMFKKGSFNIESEGVKLLGEINTFDVRKIFG